MPAAIGGEQMYNPFANVWYNSPRNLTLQQSFYIYYTLGLYCLY
jgi:hypothetical protein